MAEINIYFDDLPETFQKELWIEVKQELLDYGEVAPKRRDESEDEFQRRLEEDTDHYINTHNFANRFVI